MKARINSIGLIGTDRRVTCEPGLNIVAGPIATGKTTFLRLCRALFAGDLDQLPVEVHERVTAIAGELTLGAADFAVVRPCVTTEDAKVDVAGPGVALRLPVRRPRPEAPLTYGQWLLQTLQLPRVDVPSDPRRPESVPTPVSINDYFLYCHLRQTEIDRSVFAHRDYFKNVKRRYVFEIVYGLYDVGIAGLQERLREIDGKMRTLRADKGFFDRFAEGTPWENRARLTQELAQARQRLRAVEVSAQDVAERSRGESGIQELQAGVTNLEQQLAGLRQEIDRERESARQLERLVAQLETQSTRLTKAIVAESVLVDYDFLVCPRCGSAVDQGRGTEETCYVCLQRPSRVVGRDDLVREQARLDAQVSETRELIAMHDLTADRKLREVRAIERQRDEAEQQLEFRLRTFVSRNATEITAAAADRANLQQLIRRDEDYLALYERLDAITSETAALEVEAQRIRSELELAEGRQTEAEERIGTLESYLEEILRIFRAPEFGGAEVRASIDRDTYLPIVNGRRFEQIQSLGLNVLINVAHALSHQLTAIDLGLALPQILLIDGLTSHIGHEGLDQERVDAVYAYLVRLSEERGSELQLIVVDNTVPQPARQFVRLALSDRDRLIPIPNTPGSIKGGERLAR